MNKTPYQRLMNDALMLKNRIQNPRRLLMCIYPDKAVSEGATWELRDLRERVRAAQQLGFHVELVADASGNLCVRYVEPPEIPILISTGEFK